MSVLDALELNDIKAVRGALDKGSFTERELSEYLAKAVHKGFPKVVELLYSRLLELVYPAFLARLQKRRLPTGLDVEDLAHDVIVSRAEAFLKRCSNATVPSDDDFRPCFRSDTPFQYFLEKAVMWRLKDLCRRTERQDDHNVTAVIAGFDERSSSVIPNEPCINGILGRRAGSEVTVKPRDRDRGKQPLASHESPEQECMQSDLRERVTRFLNAYRHRKPHIQARRLDVLRLFYLEESTRECIASVLGVSVETVKKDLDQGRKYLRGT